MTNDQTLPWTAATDITIFFVVCLANSYFPRQDRDSSNEISS